MEITDNKSPNINKDMRKSKSCKKVLKFKKACSSSGIVQDYELIMAANSIAKKYDAKVVSFKIYDIMSLCRSRITFCCTEAAWRDIPIEFMLTFRNKVEDFKYSIK